MESEKRRLYWQNQMTEGLGFFDQVLKCPIEECGESLISLEGVVSSEKIDADFSRSEIIPGMERMFYLRSGLIPNFIGMAREFNHRGMILRIEDAYRNLSMQKELALSDNVLGSLIEQTSRETGKYPPDADLVMQRLKVMVACCARTATHMSGSALDLSVYKADGSGEIDRGAAYLELSELTPMDSPFISDQASGNRGMITAIMKNHGFVAYPYEFWHYSSQDVLARTASGSREPARYGPVDFEPSSGRTTEISDIDEMLNTEEEFQRRIIKLLEN